MIKNKNIIPFEKLCSSCFQNWFYYYIFLWKNYYSIMGWL